MNDWMVPLGFFIEGAMLLLMVLGLGAAVIMPGVDRWSKRFFIALFTVLSLLMCACLVDEVVYQNPNMVTVERIVWFIESLLLSVPMIMLTVFMLHRCGETIKTSPLFRTVLALWAVYLILLGIAQFNPHFFYVTPENQFAFGPWYPLLPAPMDAVMLLNLAGVIRRRKRLSKKTYHAFLVFLLPLTTAMLVHTFVFSFLLVAIGFTLFALSMFGLILFDEIEQNLRQQREIAHQRASIMVLQMRPHFIYNTMSSIYYLCDQDPKKAQRVTMDFTTYLRKNFTAIASDHTIPFSEELEHTRAYLAVEQAQFEDGLFVDYDTPHTRFRVPPLTLQPIVENAVKHGLDPESDPLRILVRTRETDSGSEILVEDNGPGFDPGDDDRPHIALANIQQRLEMMCGGKLAILPRKGGGTVVRMTIPVVSE